MLKKIILEKKISDLSKDELQNLKGFLIGELQINILEAQKILSENLPIFQSNQEDKIERIVNKLLRIGLTSSIIEENEECFEFTSFLDDELKISDDEDKVPEDNSPEEDTTTDITNEESPTEETTKTNTNSDSKDPNDETPSKDNEIEKSAEVLVKSDILEANSINRIDDKVENKSKEVLINLSNIVKMDNIRNNNDLNDSKEQNKKLKSLSLIKIHLDKSPRLKNLIILLGISTILFLFNSINIKESNYNSDIKIVSEEIDLTPTILKEKNDFYEVEIKVINNFIKSVYLSFQSKESPRLTPEEIILGKKPTPWIKSGLFIPNTFPITPEKIQIIKGNVLLTIKNGSLETKIKAVAEIQINLKKEKDGEGLLLFCNQCNQNYENKGLILLANGDYDVNQSLNFQFKN